MSIKKIQEIITQDSWQNKWALMLLCATLLSYSFHKSKKKTFLLSNFAGTVPSVSNLPLLTNVGTKQHQLRF